MHVCACLPPACQFVNKVLYLREGARDFIDRSCSNLPSGVRLFVDDEEVAIPQVRAHIRMRAHMHTHAHTHTHARLYARTHACTHARAYTLHPLPHTPN